MIEEQNINQLPKDWKWVKLKDISESIQYGYTESSSREVIGPKFLRITDIQDNKVLWNEVPYCKIDNETKKKYLLRDGDLVFARTGATVGKSFLIKGKIPDAVFASYLIRVRVSKEINERYLSNFFQSIIYWSQITDRQVGIGQPNVNGTKLGQLNLPLPPKPTQQAIVSKIEELFSELDKGVEQLKIAQQQLKTYCQSVLKWAFEGKLTNSLNHDFYDLPDEHDFNIAAEPNADYKTKNNQGNQNDHINQSSDKEELPKGWKRMKLGEYIEDISAGKSVRCDERPPKNGEVGIVKVSSVTWGFFDEMESKTCFSKDFLNEKYLIKKEDFLFSRANTIELIGACVLVNKIDKTLMLSDKILRFTFSKNVSKEFVLYYLRSRKGRKQIEMLSTGNQDSMRNIGQEKIRQIEFPYCSIEEQNNIVQEIESRLSVADKMEESITQSLQQAEALRQSILKKAFEGRLM